MSEDIIEINDNTFEEEVIKETGTVLVDFWASWCGPCLIVAPLLEKITQALKDRLKVCKLNVDENQRIASQFGIMSIPTLIIFKKGKEQERIIGAIGESEIMKRLEKYIV